MKRFFPDIVRRGGVIDSDFQELQINSDIGTLQEIDRMSMKSPTWELLSSTPPRPSAMGAWRAKEKVFRNQ